VDLSGEEIRVLGALVEKALATPQAYPLTLNSLRLACNQSTNRQPVVDYGDHQVEAVLGSLRARGLTRVVHSTSNRAAKYRHVLDEAWHLGVPELAVLSVLALRGPQTLGELKARTERLHPFADLVEVEATLDRLAAAEPEPLATRLDRQPGQKDARYAPLLGTAAPTAMPADLGGPTDPPTPGDLRPTSVPGSADRIAGDAGSAPRTGAADEAAALRADVAGLQAEVARLRAELTALWDLLGERPPA
jgi:uncharacterized protein YceH (UPF0502 family)